MGIAGVSQPLTIDYFVTALPYSFLDWIVTLKRKVALVKYSIGLERVRIRRGAELVSQEVGDNWLWLWIEEDPLAPYGPEEVFMWRHEASMEPMKDPGIWEELAVVGEFTVYKNKETLNVKG